MKLCSLEAEKKKSNFLESPILEPYSKEKVVESDIVNPKDLEFEVSLNKVKTISKSDNHKESKIRELEVNTEIIRPKTILANNKRFATASISSIRKKINDDSNLKIEETQKQKISVSHFSQLELENKWNKFADLRKTEGKMGLYTTLTKSKPFLKKDYLISFEIDSEVQKLNFERSQLLLILDRTPNAKRVTLIYLLLKHLTLSVNSRERFFQMAEKNPDLHNLKETFDLDIEF